MTLGVCHPEWSPVCVVSAELQGAIGILVKKHIPIFSSYRHIDCKIGIRFGGTELEAYVEWTTSKVGCCFSFNDLTDFQPRVKK
jgi:hypothetical protein